MEPHPDVGGTEAPGFLCRGTGGELPPKTARSSYLLPPPVCSEDQGARANKCWEEGKKKSNKKKNSSAAGHFPARLGYRTRAPSSPCYCPLHLTSHLIFSRTSLIRGSLSFPTVHTHLHTSSLVHAPSPPASRPQQRRTRQLGASSPRRIPTRPNCRRQWPTGGVGGRQ